LLDSTIRFNDPFFQEAFRDMGGVCQGFPVPEQGMPTDNKGATAHHGSQN
jgi:hypothetical protein